MGQQNQKLQNAVEGDENNANQVQLTNCHRGHGRPLPLELNCEIFKFLKLPNQRKLIVGMGRGIYGIFRQRLLRKVFFYASSTIGTKRLINSKGIRWNGAKLEAKISWNGLKASVRCDWFPTRFYSSGWQYVFANKGFVISEAFSRKENFPGAVVYYFEVTQISTITSISTIKPFAISLSNGIIPAVHARDFHRPDFYGFTIGNITNDFSYVAGNPHGFEWPIGVIKPEWKRGPGDVIGCGILLNSDMKLAVFFTGNGILMGKPIPINPSIDCLIPTACLLNCSVEANFGDNLVNKPFKFDINECPGLDFE